MPRLIAVLGFFAIALSRLSNATSDGPLDTVHNCIRYTITSPPGGTPCNKLGILGAPGPFRDIKIPVNHPTSIKEACRDLCMDMDNSLTCKSYAIGYTNRNCRLFRKGLAEQKFKASKKGKLNYYSLGCAGETCQTSYTTNFASAVVVDYDDDVFNIDLPFPVEYYGQTYSKIYMSVNGFIGFGAGPFDLAFTNFELPQYDNVGRQLPDEAVCAFWDDLLVQKKDNRLVYALDQNLLYEYSGDVLAGRAQVALRWKVAPRADPTLGLLDMRIVFRQDSPGAVNIYYDAVPRDNGGSATIGAQSKSARQFVRWSYNTPGNIASGDEIFINTRTNRLQYVPGS